MTLKKQSCRMYIHLPDIMNMMLLENCSKEYK